MSRQLNSVKHYLNVRDTLIYIANSTKPVSAKDLELDVLNTKQANIRIFLKQLTEAGLIERINTTGQTTFYVATELSMSMYKKESNSKWMTLKEVVLTSPLLFRMGKQVKVQLTECYCSLTMPDKSIMNIPSDTMCEVSKNIVTITHDFECFTLTTHQLKEYYP